MFENVNKYSLWDLATDSVKLKDANTTQLSYEGEQRGETQRFLITAGDLVTDFFNKVETSFHWKNPSETPYDLLGYLQKELYAEFVILEVANEALVRNILDEIINAWKLKGTTAFLHWIIWKVFGWRLVDLLTLNSDALYLSVFSSFIYDPSLPYEDQFLIFDPDIMATGGTGATLVIDVFNDSDFLDKKNTLESLATEWTIAENFQYQNTP